MRETTSMATDSKTNLKDRIAENKLVKDILIDMVDSYIDSITGPLDFETAAIIQVDGDNKLVFNTDGSYVFYHMGAKRLEQDVNGTFAYNGANIPSDLDLANFNYSFHEGGKVVMVGKTDGITFDSVNAYIVTLSGGWRAINTGFSTLEYKGTDFFEKRISTTNVVTPGNGGDTVAWQLVERITNVTEGGAGPYDLQIAAGSSVVAQL